METRRTRHGEQGLAVTLAFVVALACPVCAFAQTTNDAGASGWSLPDQAAPPEAPAAPLPPSPPQATAPQPATPPPAEQPAPPQAGASSMPRFPVTFSTEVAMLEIRGPGIEKSLACSGTCSYSLAQGTYWIDIRASGRTWTQRVSVYGPEHVVIETPNASARGLGIASIIVGGIVVSIAASFVYVVALNCGNGGPYEGTPQCRNDIDELPYWAAAGGVGLAVSAVGIGVFISNNKPSVEIFRRDSHARREPGTFVGLGPVEGSALPGLSLRASF